MRRWRKGCLIGLCLVAAGSLAASEPQATLPQDFIAEFQAADAAYARKDTEGIISHYAPNCTFLLVTPEYDLAYKTADGKYVKSKIKATRKRHDVAWQRQELQQLFFVTRQPFGQTISMPLQSISVTSDIRQSFFSRKAAELRLTVKREIHSHQGQAQGILSEMDEEIWGKSAQGWKLKHRAIHQNGGWLDFS